MTTQQANEVDMVDYLSWIGHEPARILQNSYWYISPLRNETSPSFKVNRVMNRSYDFAERKVGNLVDFGTRYHHCSVGDFLKKLEQSGALVYQQQKVFSDLSISREDKRKIFILSKGKISSYSLVKYLRSRRIADQIAAKYLKEVRYSTRDKIYFTLRFKNDSGGYELRNEHFKGSSSPKDVTFIDNGARDLAVFEGLFNFLSHRTMFLNQEESTRNFLVLNTALFFSKSIPKMLEHERVHLFLDNDKTGQKCTLDALTLDSQKFQDERKLYKKYNDLNDWLTHIGQPQKDSIPGKSLNSFSVAIACDCNQIFRKLELIKSINNLWITPTGGAVEAACFAAPG